MLGEIHEDIVFPYPVPRGEETKKIRRLIDGFRTFAADRIAPGGSTPRRGSRTTSSPSSASSD
jgi:hypothetical protein